MKQPAYASTVERTIERINAEKLDWLPHPGNESLYLRADCDGIWMCHAADDSRIVKQADSWISARRVSLAKPEAPECVCILADVPQESNAIVMARAVAVVRNARLTREYLAAHDGDAATLDAGISDNEQVRALAHEQARADAARVLSGVALCDIAPCPSNRDPMATEHCDTCGAALESGQIGDCDECQEEPQEFINHYKCPECQHEWRDQWTAQCDDDCPECGARHISPFKSEDA